MSEKDKEILEEATSENLNASIEENTAENTAEQDNTELTAEEKLQNELNEANEKIATLEDKYLRQVAEFDNYRKRTIKEKAEIIKNGGERVIESILPVLDDFESAKKFAYENAKERAKNTPKDLKRWAYLEPKDMSETFDYLACYKYYEYSNSAFFVFVQGEKE